MCSQVNSPLANRIHVDVLGSVLKTNFFKQRLSGHVFSALCPSSLHMFFFHLKNYSLTEILSTYCIFTPLRYENWQFLVDLDSCIIFTTVQFQIICTTLLKKPCTHKQACPPSAPSPGALAITNLLSFSMCLWLLDIESKQYHAIQPLCVASATQHVLQVHPCCGMDASFFNITKNISLYGFTTFCHHSLNIWWNSPMKSSGLGIFIVGNFYY